MSNVKWNDAELIRDLIEATDRGIGQAGEVVATQAKINISKAGLSRQAKAGRLFINAAKEKAEQSGLSLSRTLLTLIGRNKKTGRLKTRSGSGVKVREALSSRRTEVDPPGGFPRLRTGFLRRSIRTGHPGAPVKGEIWVGSTMDYKTGYAAAHELGSPKHKIPARPYIRPAFLSTQSEQAEAFDRAAKAYMEGKGY